MYLLASNPQRNDSKGVSTGRIDQDEFDKDSE
jgi:hypothetical protein